MTGFAVAGLLVGLVGIVSHYRPVDSTYTLALSAFALYLGVGGVVAAMLFALLRSAPVRSDAPSVVVVVVWTARLQAPANVAQTVPEHGTDVLVMTSDLKVGAADPRAMVQAVRSQRVDILMLEEVTPETGMRCTPRVSTTCSLIRSTIHATAAPGRACRATTR